MSEIIKKFYKDLFLANRLFAGIFLVVFLFILSFFFPWLGEIPIISFFAILILLALDIVLLYRIEGGVFVRRSTPERLSNGDENRIDLHIENKYTFSVFIELIDEIPHQFQKRDVCFHTTLQNRQSKTIDYYLRPLKRGEYDFGSIQTYVQSPLALIKRRYTFEQPQVLAVYPSFIQMRKYELMAISNTLVESGIKKIRRLGHSMEFEQIRSYVPGDDFRTINWKVSARRGDLMVNTYTDEKSQHVYCVIDKSRAMKMPFDGLSLLDYSINASLALSNVAMLKDDKAGLITVSEKIGTILAADRKPAQLHKILEILYKEKTRYLEVNMEALYSTIRFTLKQRSLIVFFTNFESMSALERQLPFLKKIARFHLLVIVFFENTELKQLANEPAKDLEGIYIKTIAEKFAYEKKQIVLELARFGIQSILTSPKNLTVNTLNKYLEIKASQTI